MMERRAEGSKRWYISNRYITKAYAGVMDVVEGSVQLRGGHVEQKMVRVMCVCCVIYQMRLECLYV